ncbi:MAG TPA: sugar ABC transporter substrate-binding protein [Kofleriaceae bacterium]|nr:sugar ABC transporter substrate-binding protein [Kofleriaceae bacterium]
MSPAGTARSLACAAVIAGLAACAGSDETVLTLWAVGREGELVAQLTQEFEASHPGIRIDVQQLPWRGAHEKLLTSFVGEATPDLAQMGNTWIPEFAELGALAPLDRELAASPIVDQKDYFPGIWDTNVYKGHVYGVPWYVDTRILFYRRDLLARAGYDHPPRSWDEWLDMMRAIVKREGRDHYAALLPLNEFEQLLALGLQQDEPLLRDGGRRGNFRGAGFRHALSFYVGLFRDGLAPRVTNLQVANVYEEFARGWFAFYITGPWQIGEFKRRLPASLQGSWMTAPLPGPVGPGASSAGGASLVVFASSPHRQVAWQLIEFLSRPDVQRRFYTMSGNLPPRRTTWEGAPVADDVHAAAFKDQLERVKPTPKVPEWERIAQQLRIASERVVRGGESADVALRDLDARADEILEKRRWMLARNGTQ